jgi:hypothetical protein
MELRKTKKKRNCQNRRFSGLGTDSGPADYSAEVLTAPRLLVSFRGGSQANSIQEQVHV